jgi:hypothetical protein
MVVFLAFSFYSCFFLVCLIPFFLAFQKIWIFFTFFLFFSFFLIFYYR